MPINRTFIISLFLLGAILASNIWLPWDQAVEYMYKQDVSEYMKISKAAPYLTEEKVGFHFAQRFFFSYLVGVTAKVFSIDSKFFYYLFTLFIAVGIIFVFIKSLEALKLSYESKLIAIWLLVCNPYTFRYYALVPGMSQGLLFNLGLTILFYGLITTQNLFLFLGVILAGLGRQTTILILPGILGWILFSTKWKSNYLIKQRVAFSLGVVLCELVIYLGTSYFAQMCATPSTNYAAIAGTYLWIKSSNFSFLEMTEFSLRIILPFLLTLSFILTFAFWGKNKAAFFRSPEFICSCFITLSIIAQPFLAGPTIAGQSATRLSAHGLIPFLFSFAYIFKENTTLWKSPTSSFTFIGILGLIFIGSFHHLYTVIGPSTAAQYAFMQVILCLIIALLNGLLLKKAKSV